MSAQIVTQSVSAVRGTLRHNPPYQLITMNGSAVRDIVLLRRLLDCLSGRFGFLFHDFRPSSERSLVVELGTIIRGFKRQFNYLLYNFYQIIFDDLSPSIAFITGFGYCGYIYDV